MPTSWEIHEAGLLGDPFEVFVAFPNGLADGPAPRPVSMQVSRFTRQGLDYEFAVFELHDDPWCSASLRVCDEAVVSEDVIRVGGQWGVLREARRADGSHRWTLVVQNDCYTYNADAQVSPDRLNDAAAIVHVLSSTSVPSRARNVFGLC